MTTDEKIVITDKATVYFIPENSMSGNVRCFECRRIEIEFRPYAQHERALFLRFIPKGNRSYRTSVFTSDPFLIVYDGHVEHLLRPDDPMVPVGDDMEESRYPSHDPRWRSDFEAKIQAATLPDTPAFDSRVDT